MWCAVGTSNSKTAQLKSSVMVSFDRSSYHGGFKPVLLGGRSLILEERTHFQNCLCSSATCTSYLLFLFFLCLEVIPSGAQHQLLALCLAVTPVKLGKPIWDGRKSNPNWTHARQVTYLLSIHRPPFVTSECGLNSIWENVCWTTFSCLCLDR